MKSFLYSMLGYSICDLSYTLVVNIYQGGGISFAVKDKTTLIVSLVMLTISIIGIIICRVKSENKRGKQ